MKRRNIDPHVDPLRAPSRAGHHPHLVPEGPSKKNPQGMYEHRGEMPPAQYGPAAARPVGQIQQPPQSDFWKLAGIFGLGALAVYLGYKASQDAQEGQEPRRNPEPPPMPVQPAPAQLVVMPGPVPALPFAVDSGLAGIIPQTGSLATASKAVKKADQAIQTHAVEMATDSKPAKKKRGPRTRMTSQARNEQGKYMSAGTRARRVREGKKDK